MAEGFDWKNLFQTNESPYFPMHSAGRMGISFEECKQLCERLLIVLRPKDVQAWRDGYWKYKSQSESKSLNPILRPPTQSISLTASKLSDHEKYPDGWTGTDKRWFPCSAKNTPLQKWGYKDDFTPTLYDRASAEALSPVGWVAQNLYAQPFIVIDIDGVGHGATDYQVMEFGNKFRTLTEVWEDPYKPGSFHIYLDTEYKIPIGHWSYAKLDLMGNQTNAAVYGKNKQSNGVSRARLTEDIWKELMDYINHRKEQRDNIRQAMMKGAGQY